MTSATRTKPAQPTESPAPEAPAPEAQNPQAGGAWVRDPITGALMRDPAEHPTTPTDTE